MKIYIDVELPQGCWPDAHELALKLQQEVRFMVSEQWGTEWPTGSKVKTWFQREQKNSLAVLLPKSPLSCRPKKRNEGVINLILLTIGFIAGAGLMSCLVHYFKTY